MNLCCPFMRRSFILAALFAIAVSAFVYFSRQTTRAERPAPPRTTHAQLPVHFEPNYGQLDASVRFQARGNGYQILLTDTETVLQLPKTPGGLTERQQRASRNSLTSIRLGLNGANTNAPFTPLDAQVGKSNYFLGNRPERWRTDVPHFARIQRENIYPGVNLVYYNSEQQLEYDFVVAPHADPSKINLSIAGASNISLDRQGDLIISTPAGAIKQHKPVAYQEIAGQRREVAARYKVESRKSKLSPQHSALITFVLGTYDPNFPLVIDPVLSYATFLGGSGTDYGNSIAVDNSGNIYVTGETNSTNFPITGGVQSALAGNTDVFVTKLNPAGNAIIYSTFVGGEFGDRGDSITLDAAGNAYVAGRNSSEDFPVTAGAFQFIYRGGDFDGFAFKLNAAGNALTYSTFLGGGDNDAAVGIALDSGNNAYVTGGTKSVDFPAFNAFQPNNAGETDGFLVKLNPTGTNIAYSTFLGGSTTDRGSAVAVDAQGNVIVAGLTRSTDFPAINASQATLGGNFDAFVSKFNAAGTQAVYSTYLGGVMDDRAFGLALDATGNVYVTGQAGSAFPTQSALFPTYGGGPSDAFVAKFNAAGARQFSTYLGGGSDDKANSIALRGNNLYLTGFTASTNFPTLNPSQAANAGLYDAFVAKMDTGATALGYSTYLGGSGNDNFNGQNITASGSIAVDAAGSAYVIGSTVSANFPTVNPLRPTYGGGLSDAYIARLTDAMPTPTPTPSFSFSINFPAVAIAPGGAVSGQGTVIGANDFIGPVSLSVSGLPAGVSGDFNPSVIDAFPVSPRTSDLVLNIPAATAPGVYPLIVRGVAGSLLMQTTATLTISPNAAPPLMYVANMNGAQVAPPNNSPATGTATLLLFPGNTARVSLVFSNLSGANSGSAIRSPSLPLLPSEPLPTGNFTAHTFRLKSPIANALPSGALSVEVSGSTFSPEISGPLMFSSLPPNPSEVAPFFTRQHYLDFLNREPDAGGLAYWTGQLTACGADAACLNRRRVDVSAAFFVETEFQNSGYFVYLTRRAALGPQPNFAQYLADRNQIGTGAEADKLAFLNAFTQRAEFLQKYPLTLSSLEFVNALLANTRQATGVNLDDLARNLLNDFIIFGSRARLLRIVVDDPRLRAAEYNQAFVLAQYFGYLRRDVDIGGYNFWLSTLNANPNNFRGMVCAFITSLEYQQRFSPVATRSNADCAGIGP